jgi:peptidoglycan/xylan/chitin deacetylase (PgdA/CDA1 family)
MMAPMKPADLSHVGPFASVAQAVFACVPLGFVLAAQQNLDAAFFPVLLAVMASGVLAAHVLPRSRTLAGAGCAVAVTAAWLLPQRDDVAAAVILTFLFTVAFGAVIARFWSNSGSLAKGMAESIASVVVLLALFLLAPQSVLLFVVVIAVIAATTTTLLGILPAPAPAPAPKRGRAIAYGTVLVVTTLIFTGYIGAETPAATWFGGGAVHGPTDTGEVALTFDDGPNLGSSEKIMAILDAHGIKGTFFEVGKAIDAAPQITRALYADGQLLGNHSYEHDQWRWLDPRYPELQRTQDAFERAIGTCPVLYRPPHGDRTPFLARVVRDHHMHMVLWSASAGDWATDDAQLVARRILSKARPGAILLLHDGLDGNPAADRSVLVRALPLIIDGLRAKGLSPVRLDRLLGTAASLAC